MIYRLDCFLNFKSAKHVCTLFSLIGAAKKTKQLDEDTTQQLSQLPQTLKQAYIQHVHLFPFFKQQKATPQ